MEDGARMASGISGKIEKYSLFQRKVDESDRVHPAVQDSHSPMKVRTRRTTCASDEADDLAFSDELAAPDFDLGKMAIGGKETEPVIEDHSLARKIKVARQDDSACVRGSNWVASWGRNVHA